MNFSLGIDAKVTVLAAGLIFLLALFLGVWKYRQNLTAAMVVVVFFVGAIIGYIGHGLRRDTVNQFENPDRGIEVAMAPLIAGEIGGFSVLLAGFVAGQLM
jgi:hypothetical protein